MYTATSTDIFFVFLFTKELFSIFFFSEDGLLPSPAESHHARWSFIEEENRENSFSYKIVNRLICRSRHAHKPQLSQIDWSEINRVKHTYPRSYPQILFASIGFYADKLRREKEGV